MATNNERVTRSKKHARLHRSFSRISKALIKKLHGGGGGHANTKDTSSSASTSFLSGCMHPRTNSFASSGRRHQATANNGGCKQDKDDGGALAVDFRSIRLGAAAAVIDEGGSSSATQDCYTNDGGSDEESECTPAVVTGGGVAVVTFSAAPYQDFRRSMREMVDAARRDAAEAAASRAPSVDWDLMEELLFCYLEINDRAVHKDILHAFTDTVAALRRRRRCASAAKSRRTRRQQRRTGRASEHDIDDAKAVASS